MDYLFKNLKELNKFPEIRNLIFTFLICIILICKFHFGLSNIHSFTFDVYDIEFMHAHYNFRNKCMPILL